MLNLWIETSSEYSGKLFEIREMNSLILDAIGKNERYYC